MIVFQGFLIFFDWKNLKKISYSPNFLWMAHLNHCGPTRRADLARLWLWKSEPRAIQSGQSKMKWCSGKTGDDLWKPPPCSTEVITWQLLSDTDPSELRGAWQLRSWVMTHWQISILPDNSPGATRSRGTFAFFSLMNGWMGWFFLDEHAFRECLDVRILGQHDGEGEGEDDADALEEAGLVLGLQTIHVQRPHPGHLRPREHCPEIWTTEKKPKIFSSSFSLSKKDVICFT